MKTIRLEENMFGDRLFLLDKLRGTKFYEFKIEE
jgi:hypothetical protein